jgi:hypothetical protein
MELSVSCWPTIFRAPALAASASIKKMNYAMKKAHARRTAADSTRPRYAFFGETVAIIYGSEHAIGKDKTRPDAKVCQVWTDTWLKRDGKWQIVASQDNRVDCK